MANFNIFWPIPFPGIPVDILWKYLDVFRKMREAGQLEELNPQTVTANQVLFSSAPGFGARTGFFGFVGRLFGLSAAPFFRVDFDIRGGIKAPHIHLDGKIYLLNKEQWGEFSGKVVEDFQARLDSAKTVPLSVDQVLGLAEASKSLGV